ncbi:hypothetical protein L873DRAFT_1799357 [Choiromyces venosus 120613-1]|uniref:Uncharacterized protein n=1 Tax=Choiromyces venosus 120613-1 TaxID=1336337 RepID=A0A3N4K1J2_9PEZI|nr:hypothetical protein L873DRAFT_1799357 [Choiromyces venosus 120613-1]
MASASAAHPAEKVLTRLLIRPTLQETAALDHHYVHLRDKQVHHQSYLNLLLVPKFLCLSY